MFLWIFVAALVMSHVANFFHSKAEPFIDFSIDGTEIEQWIRKLDSSASFPSIMSSGTSNGEGADADMVYSIRMDTATDVEALTYLQECILYKANLDQWQCLESGSGNDSFHFLLSKGSSKFRIYAWSLPTSTEGQLDYLKSQGKNVMQLKMLQVGYKYRD